MSKRAVRRHHLRRMKARAIRIYSNVPPEDAIKWANHLKMCSRYCCGNPRHFFKSFERITRQEYFSQLDYLESVPYNNDLTE